MKVKDIDFQFFSFFVGIQRSELDKIKTLIESFPYSDSHKIFVIDKSKSAHKILSQTPNRFYDSPRSYVDDYKPNISIEEIDSFFDSYSDLLVRLEQEEYTFHGTGVDDAITKYSDKPYVVILDSDIEFHKKSYLEDMIKFINNNNDDIAAIGSIVQKQLFHLTINKIFSADFLFMFSNDNTLMLRTKLKYVFVETFSIILKLLKIISIKRKPSLGRFPRFHPLLLTINKEYYLANKLEFGYSFLTVKDYNEKINQLTDHKIFGDSGSTFLHDIAKAGGNVINIDYNYYVSHARKGSYGEATKSEKRWNWFNL